MENASKALIMAGGILIGVIIITIGVYLFSSFGGTSKEIQQQIDARVIAEFNENFLKYQGSKTCTIHDIVSLANFANKNNEDFTENDDYYVNVFIGNQKLTSLSYSEQRYIDLLEIDRQYTVDTGKIQYYKCDNIKLKEVEGYKRVVSITFKKI